jgi:hypothetical protein
MGKEERTSLEHFFKEPTRPVKEIIKEMLPILRRVASDDNVTKVICHIYPWINSSAVANEEQQLVLKKTTWYEGDAYRAVIMLNSLRG